MTRLEAFAARLTREMMEAYWSKRQAGTEDDQRAAARAVSARMIREFVAQGADQYMGAAQMERYCDEPAEN